MKCLVWLGKYECNTLNHLDLDASVNYFGYLSQVLEIGVDSSQRAH